MRIVGGTNAEIKDYPFAAAIKKDKEHFCGGVIISRRHILSVAHCFDDIRYDQIKVYIGSNLRHSTDSSYRLLEIDVHPEYTGILTNQNSLYNDIAVATVFSKINNYTLSYVYTSFA
jgi:trypsin